MFITSLTGKSQVFIGRLAQSDLSRSPITTLALGRLLGYTVDIPNGKVEDIENYFLTSVKLTLLGTLDQINELVPISHEAVLEAAKKFYLYRYSAAYPEVHILPSVAQPLAAFFRITKYFSPEELDIINGSISELARLTLEFIDLCADLQSKGSADVA